MTEQSMWKAGTAKAIITPEKPIWLAGYGARTRPAEGKRHDLWVKALALEDQRGRRILLLTNDLLGFSKDMYDRLCEECERRFGLDRSQVMLTGSHNHCGPVITDSLPDYYPLDETQKDLIREYTSWVEAKILETMQEALSLLEPVRLSAGEGTATFAVNRRNNREAGDGSILEEGKPLKGPVDHSVPVLAVHTPDDRLKAIVFGYACHPTTLADYLWCGDYPGYAQIALEQAHPGALAMFWTGCGGDQNPLPRRKEELCEKYGQMLAAAVEEVLRNPLRPLSSHLRTAFEFVPLPFERNLTRQEIEAFTGSQNAVQRRWANRTLALLDAGQTFATDRPYGVQVWRLGEQLWIALGAEAVVDYSLRFKREFGSDTWICGYAHDMVAYIPSHRVWEEGGYEADYVWEYGWPAERWTSDVEDRVSGCVHRLVRSVAPENNKKG